MSVHSAGEPGASPSATATPAPPGGRVEDKGQQSVEFCTPPRILMGGGMVARLADEVVREGAVRPLVVTDPWFSAQSSFERIRERLLARGLPARVFDRVQPDPTTSNVADGLAALREHGADLVIAVGGGSSIDCAKAIAVLAANPVPIQSLAGYHKVMRPGLPLIAVPTTAGTGSEATKVTVITDTERDVKMMMLDAHFTPSVAIVDYELTVSMPPALTAHVGMDTLTHGIEAYVSRRASLLTDALALSCAGLCARHLRRAVNNPNDLEARAGMAAAACQGGLAFANSSVCLVHGMSRPIGAVFHLPHGLSNATLLETVTRFSLKGAPARYAEIARTMHLCGEQTPDAEACDCLVEELASLSRELGVPRLRHCQGVHEARFKQSVPKMALDALASGSPQNNPVIPTAAEIEALYLQAF